MSLVRLGDLGRGEGDAQAQLEGGGLGDGGIHQGLGIVFHH